MNINFVLWFRVFCALFSKQEMEKGAVEEPTTLHTSFNISVYIYFDIVYIKLVRILYGKIETCCCNFIFAYLNMLRGYYKPGMFESLNY